MIFLPPFSPALSPSLPPSASPEKMKYGICGGEKGVWLWWIKLVVPLTLAQTLNPHPFLSVFSKLCLAARGDFNTVYFHTIFSQPDNLNLPKLSKQLCL